MSEQPHVMMMEIERKHLFNILNDFTPEQGDFRPVEGMMTAAQLIRHIARAIKWFREGGFGDGFDMDFEKWAADDSKPVSLADAKDELNRTYDDFIEFLKGKDMGDLMQPMVTNEIFGDSPRIAVLHANQDHTAHHRGALTVYLRLLGKTPTLVYSK
jgi:uncharacterized damage-inducible protein DinB